MEHVFVETVTVQPYDDDGQPAAVGTFHRECTRCGLNHTWDLSRAGLDYETARAKLLVIGFDTLEIWWSDHLKDCCR